MVVVGMPKAVGGVGANLNFLKTIQKVLGRFPFSSDTTLPQYRPPSTGKSRTGYIWWILLNVL